MEVVLRDYPQVRTSSSFLATISPCKVEQLEAVTTPDQSYNIQEPALVFAVGDFVQVP